MTDDHTFPTVVRGVTIFLDPQTPCLSQCHQKFVVYCTRGFGLWGLGNVTKHYYIIVRTHVAPDTYVLCHELYYTYVNALKRQTRAAGEHCMHVTCTVRSKACPESQRGP